MTTLITSEWYKLLRGRLLLIILAGVAMETLLQVLSAYSVSDDDLLGQGGVTLAASKSFVMQIWFSAFAGFFVASEFQHGTIRNVLALGKNRANVYLSKLLTVCMAVAAIIFVISITATIGYGVAFRFGDMPLAAFIRYFAWHYGMQTLYHLSFAAIFTMFGYITRNIGVTILLGVGYMLATQVMVGFLGNFPGGRLVFLVEWLPQYYIANFGHLSADPAFVAKGIAVSAANMIAASIIGCVVFSKSDIR